MENNPYESKVITLLKRKGNLVFQEESPVFLLSSILEAFVSEYADDSCYEKELALAKRLDDFLLGDKEFYYDA